jgi:cytochrome c oxidase subunit 4
MSDHAIDVDHHVRTYLLVFSSLMMLTLLTVGAWYFLHMPVGPTIALALFIATIKASLVACFFMHLISEKKFILWLLALSLFFFFMLLLLPVWTSIINHVGL